MKSVHVASILMIAALFGCKSQQEDQSITPTAASNAPAVHQPNTAAPPPAVATNSNRDVIATIGDVSITREQLEKPLFEGYGLNVLVKVTQRELAKREAQKMGLLIGQKEIDAELQRYLSTLFNEEKDPQLHRLNVEMEKAVNAKDNARAEKVRSELAAERSKLLEQLLQQQKLTRADFDLFVETNTYLRAIATAQVAKQPVTDEALRAAFNHLYGEKAQVLDIQLANMTEVQEAQRRLQKESFEQVAATMSRDTQSAPMGGELPPFSRDTPGLPRAFKDVVFALKVGQISDAVSADGSWHIVMLKRLIPPNKLIDFNVVKDSVREFLVQTQTEGLVKEMRQTLQNQVLTSLKVSEPTLHEQFVATTTRKGEELRDKTDIRKEFDRKLQDARQATTKPSASPTTAPTTRPVP